jgi:hypothetical protein
MSFLPAVTIDASELALALVVAPHLGLAELIAAPGAVVVRGLYPPEALASFVARLELGAGAPTRFAFSSAFAAYSYGRILDQAEADLARYFDEAARYRRFTAEALAPDPEELVLATLRALAAPEGLAVPEHPERGRYALSTVRCYPPGGLIPPHCEREQLGQASYHHLRQLLAGDSIVSWYLTLQAPEEGGDLAIHDVAPDSLLGERIYAARGLSHPELDTAPTLRFATAAGDLIVFNGSARFHQVRPVRGTRARWTLGGFAARARAGGFLAWS